MKDKLTVQKQTSAILKSTLALPRRLHYQLKLFALKHGKTITEVVEESVREYIGQQKDRKRTEVSNAP